MITNQKNKLLIISGLSPFPKDSGGATRIFFTIKELSKQFDIYLVFCKNKNYSLQKEDKIFLKENTRFFYSIDISEEKRFDLFFSRKIPYWFSNWFSQELILIVNKLAKQFDIQTIQIEPSQLAYLIDFIPKNTKTHLVAYDVNSISFYRRTMEINDKGTKIIHLLLWLQIVWYEFRFLRKYNSIITMSKNDKKIVDRYFQPQKTVVVPNGIEEIKIVKPKTLSTPLDIRLGYIGSFNHPPNKKAFTFFVNNIAPLLEKNYITYQFIIAGNNNPEEINTIVNESHLIYKKAINPIGFVKSLKDFYTNIDLLIAPIYSGSGTRLKILESLSFGTPVVTTSIGAEGIENISNSYLIIANNAEDFLTSIQKHIYTQKKCINKNQLNQNMSHYLWSNIFKNYLK